MCGGANPENEYPSCIVQHRQRLHKVFPKFGRAEHFKSRGIDVEQILNRGIDLLFRIVEGPLEIVCRGGPLSKTGGSQLDAVREGRIIEMRGAAMNPGIQTLYGAEEVGRELEKLLPAKE